MSNWVVSAEKLTGEIHCSAPPGEKFGDGLPGTGSQSFTSCEVIAMSGREVSGIFQHEKKDKKCLC